MHRLLLLCLLSLAAVDLSAQVTLNGLWEGTITEGGLQSDQGYPFQVFLEKRGRTVSGRSYIQMGDRIVEMQLSGRLYDDNSIYLDEIEFISDDESWSPPFMRKYQLLWRRGIYEGSLNGYWQEIRDDVFNDARERGRITLRKVQEKRA
ncbi:MAG: hypothetical protein KDC54_19195 [Lewinella sp.]|nr:hypothetical protein [Lewinella sp.]